MRLGRVAASLLIGSLVALAAAVSTGVVAHPPAIVGQAGEKAVADEIRAFRKSMADAITSRDKLRIS